MSSISSRIIISIGSNNDPDSHIERAKALLLTAYPDIRFSPVLCTAPIDYPYSASFFLNCVAVFHTDEEEDVLCARLKSIEQTAGRKESPKSPGFVSIDIDLLYYASQLRRPQDAHRPYVLSGLSSLGCDAANTSLE